MDANLKPYPEYKESGLPWASRVPAHWSLIPNRAVLRKRKVLVGGNHKNYQLLSLTKGGVIVRDISTGKGKFSSDMGTSQEVRKGDFVFCLFDVPETPRTVGLSMHDGMITGAYTVFESRKLTMEGVRYIEHFYLAMDDQKLLSPLYSGLRHTIPPPRFLGTKTPLPPTDEQAAIVRFLDYENARIERAIRSKKKLITLLNEQKQAIIHRAVTRGLDPNVKLKPSGIPWIGDIPEHWNTPLNQCIFRENIRPHNGLPELQLSLSQRDGLIDTSKMQERSLQTSNFNNWKVTLPGDLVLNRFKAHLGVFFCATLRGIVSFHYGVFAPRVKLNTKYFELLFHTAPYRAIYAGRSNGMTVGLQNLSNQNFYNVRAIVPPFMEQVEIVAFLETATADLNKSIANTEREIFLLREYRTRLVADVVTGKLDVREAAKDLPGEVEALENIADIEDTEDLTNGEEEK
ncbi:MAG: restriction endonuclease subunit S [Victivallales bacterium]